MTLEQVKSGIDSGMVAKGWRCPEDVTATVKLAYAPKDGQYGMSTGVVVQGESEELTATFYVDGEHAPAQDAPATFAGVKYSGLDRKGRMMFGARAMQQAGASGGPARAPCPGTDAIPYEAKPQDAKNGRIARQCALKCACTLAASLPHTENTAPETVWQDVEYFAPKLLDWIEGKETHPQLGKTEVVPDEDPSDGAF